MDIGNFNTQPRFEEGSAMRLVGLLEHYDQASMHEVPLQWQRFASVAAEVPCRIDGNHFGLHYSVSENPPRFDYVSAVAVSDDATVAPGLVERNLPVGRYAVFSLAGHISELGSLFTHIFGSWLPASGYEPAGEPLFYEMYGEHFDPATATGIVEVWVPLQA
jgi:AraC family transcriptional regulator